MIENENLDTTRVMRSAHGNRNKALHRISVESKLSLIKQHETVDSGNNANFYEQHQTLRPKWFRTALDIFLDIPESSEFANDELLLSIISSIHN